MRLVAPLAASVLTCALAVATSAQDLPKVTVAMSGRSERAHV